MRIVNVAIKCLDFTYSSPNNIQYLTNFDVENLEVEDDHNIDIYNIPFTSYYGALTLVYEISPNIAKITTFSKLKKIGKYIEMALNLEKNENNQLILINAEHLKVFIYFCYKFT